MINRREFLGASLRGAAGATLAALASHTRQSAAAAGAARPNIVLVLADDLGYETLGAYGCTSYKTPELDRLAATGLRFQHCYSQPLCTPSRVEMLTGIYNVRNYRRFGYMDRDQVTLAQLLKKAGYATCVSGKWQLGHEADSPSHFGFDEYCLWNAYETGGRYANPGLYVNGKAEKYPGKFGPDIVSDFACGFLERNRNRPFLLYYPMILVHQPFVPTPDSADWHKKQGGNAAVEYFPDMVAYMDKLVGKLVRQLDELGLRDDTIVMFTGDNGTPTPCTSMCNGKPIKGGKGGMGDGGTHVPLIASWPRFIKEGKVLNDLVDFSDFLPTCCEAGGAEVPAELKIDGRSFLPQLKGEKGNPREWIYCWFARDGGPAGSEWARNQRYKMGRGGGMVEVQSDGEEVPARADDPEARRARPILQAALDKYHNARPAEFARQVGTGGKK